MLLGVNLMIDHAQWWPRDVKLFSLWTTLGWLSLDTKNCHVSPWGDTWQFSIRTFLRVSAQPSPIQRSSYFKLLSIAPPAPVKYSFSNRCLSFFSVLLLLFQETRCFPSQNIFFLSMHQMLSCTAKFSFFLSSNPFLVFTVFDSLFLLLSLFCLSAAGWSAIWTPPPWWLPHCRKKSAAKSAGNAANLA